MRMAPGRDPPARRSSSTSGQGGPVVVVEELLPILSGSSRHLIAGCNEYYVRPNAFKRSNAQSSSALVT